MIQCTYEYTCLYGLKNMNKMKCNYLGSSVEMMRWASSGGGGECGDGGSGGEGSSRSSVGRKPSANFALKHWKVCVRYFRYFKEARIK